MNKAIKIIKMTTIGVLCVLLFGYLTMLLWNWIIPSVFNVNPISFWQALGLLLLSKILFGGFGGKSWGHRGGYQWKSRYYEKLSSMSPEDRDRFKAKLREKWCSPRPDATTEK
jgi:hypothetical protein